MAPGGLLPSSLAVEPNRRLHRRGEVHRCAIATAWFMQMTERGKIGGSVRPATIRGCCLKWPKAGHVALGSLGVTRGLRRLRQSRQQPDGSGVAGIVRLFRDSRPKLSIMSLLVGG